MLTANFSLEELTASMTATRRGIDNSPTTEALKNLKVVAEAMEKVREALGNKPIKITSGYRSPKLNKAVGGSTKSAHSHGLAVDFICPAFGTPKDICKRILQAGIRFDQLIYEGTWVHLSVDPRMRNEVLTAVFVEGKAVYSKGIN